MNYKKKFKGYAPTQIERMPDEFGQSIEEQIRLATASKQPIDGSTTPVYTPMKDGVLPQFDVRTDRQEIALDALDKLAKSDYLAVDERPEPEQPQQIETTETPF